MRTPRVADGDRRPRCPPFTRSRGPRAAAHTANTSHAAKHAATTNAIRHPGPSTSAPASAAPTAIPPTNAVIGHV